MEYPNLQPKDDRRFKILPSEYEKVKELYASLKSFKAVSRLFNVDKATIKAIIDPDWGKRKQKKRYAKKPWLDSYKKIKGEKWNEIQREYKKRKLELQGDEMRAYHHSKRGKIFHEIPCIECGKMFLPKTTKNKYCSRKHYFRAYRRGNRKF